MKKSGGYVAGGSLFSCDIRDMHILGNSGAPCAGVPGPPVCSVALSPRSDGVGSSGLALSSVSGRPPESPAGVLLG